MVLQIIIDHNPHEYKHEDYCSESYIDCYVIHMSVLPEKLIYKKNAKLLKTNETFLFTFGSLYVILSI